MELTRRCNLACEHCEFHKSSRDLELSSRQMMSILDGFAQMGGKTVVTCGGESTLTGEMFWLLHRHSRELGLQTFTVTNGTRVTEMNKDRWLISGPSEITLSLDSHDPALHDEWRGKPNWHVVVAALTRLLKRRAEMGRENPRIYAMTIVAERSYRDLPKLFDFVLGELKADKLKLNIAQPTFGFLRKDDWFAANAPNDPDNLIRVIERCDEKWGINRNPRWLEDVHMYCSNIQRDSSAIRGRHHIGVTDRNICNSGDRNIWVSYKGTAALCPSAVFPGKKVKSGADVQAMWDGATHRQEMRECRNLCGISHSVRREPSTLQAVA